MQTNGWQTNLKGDSLAWLLEPDEANPGVRYFALRDLLDLPETDPDVVAAKEAVMTSGPAPVILKAQAPEGYWGKPGGGYSPKYRGTVWQIMFLAELGADPTDERVRRGCEYLLNHSLATNGAFSARQKPVPSFTLHCLNGNLLFALLRLGFAKDPRVQAALDWQAQAITGKGQVRYYQSGTNAPGFASCSVCEPRIFSVIVLPMSSRSSARADQPSISPFFFARCCRNVIARSGRRSFGHTFTQFAWRSQSSTPPGSQTALSRSSASTACG